MAFITKSSDTPCYSCSKQCINTEFCSEGNSLSIDSIVPTTYSLSRNIRVSITANPEFWGFGGVLISGWASYTNGYYDFFDGYDEDHKAYRTCDSSSYDAGPWINEQRPDIFFRSVYDPDTGITKHYGTNGSFEGSGIGRGGAEVYLVDRPKGLIASVTSDTKSCPETEPYKIFRQFPENFGWGNKINFNTKVYRNMSGAWRLTSLENCYPESSLYEPSGYLIDCSGEEKQNIAYGLNRYEKYDPTRLRASGESSYYNYQSGCRPDGSVAGKYAGYFTNTYSIYRNTAQSDFIQAHLSYGSHGNPLPASGLRNGMEIGIKNDINNSYNNVYRIFDVQHQSTYTSVKFVGSSTGNAPLEASIPTGNFTLNIGESGHWIAFGTYDEQTCCGLSAYGVSDDTKSIASNRNYHTDFRKVFNNPKNLRQSNRDREWRETYDLFDTIQSVSSEPSGAIDRTYPSVSGINIDGVDYYYPIIVSGDALIIATGEDPIESGYPLFERFKSYYGPFFETDRCDNVKRFEDSINRGKSRNGTCYSKHATLEIFPDCITQYDKYVNCDNDTIYTTNKVARLAFVYRGCDFNDECSFDENELPLGAWKDQGSIPTGIEDLKRQLAGQEIHMFVNLNSAWGGRRQDDKFCDCDNPGETLSQPPGHVMIDSPITYSHFPNFDLDPSGYGCLDPWHQTSDLMNRIWMGVYPDDTESFCDTIYTNDYSCLKRQPYTTYGYIMNLCGRESKNRKNVIKEAFSKLHQEKTYTNANSGSNIIEPMYWNIVAPTPDPVSGGGIWGSGTINREDGVGPFVQVAGSGYGYWGVADSNNQLVAPYFVTQESIGVNCDDNTKYLDYSRSGTFLNVLNTNNGWPTDKVPFLIEIETDGSCGGCVTTQMKNENLILEISGLNTEFFHGPSESLGQYGHIYCKYGAVTGGVANGKGHFGLRPTHDCDAGFDTDFCGSQEAGTKYWTAYEGNTCQCVDNFDVTLYPVIVSGTDNLVAGWTSNPIGDAAGLTEISGCNDLESSYFDVAYDEKGAGGYRIWGQFDLACPSMFTFIKQPFYPNIKYEGDSLNALYGQGCGHHYPAKVGTDLQLRTTLWMIDDRHTSTFRKLSQQGLRTAAERYGSTNVLYPPRSGDFIDYFGLCSGDMVYTWGCKPEGSEGTYFYGCQDDEGRYSGFYAACEDTTPCNTCPTGYDDGDVTCICESAVGYEGIIPRPLPIEYQFNECYCKCTTPYLLSTYTVDENGGLNFVSSNGCPDASVYYVSFNGNDPISISQGPPAPYMGIVLGANDGEDFFDWKHGVNALSSGITHELYSPYLGINLQSNTECEQLTIDVSTQPGNVINCEANTGCILDNEKNTKTCGPPIYMSGGLPEGSVTVRKKKCSPEVAIVTKIDCIEGLGYRLYLSREYHEHDRTWREEVTYEDPQDTGNYITECIPINAGYYDYNDGTNSGCHIIPYSALADTVTPITNPPCSIHPSSGEYVNQSYRYQNTISPSGTKLWNYFNLFYSSDLLPSVSNGTINASALFYSGEYICSGNPIIENTGMVFTSGDYLDPIGFNGIFATSGTHSCVQDSIECGGEIWCNKLFFPRSNYKTGTKLAPYGGSQICLSNNDISNSDNHIGYIEYTGLPYPPGGREKITIPTAIPLLNEMKTKFVDFCNDSITQEILEELDIDGTTVLVEDYLPLMGVIHPGWRFTSDVKSCTVGGTGCTENIPTHTENTILAGTHIPKTWDNNNFESMGYYLDRFGVSLNENRDGLIRASGDNQCLFNPFKILIDVECNTNRIARSGNPNDAPTYLQGIQYWPSRACLGLVQLPGCGCDSTHCAYATRDKAGECITFTLGEYIATISSDDQGDCLDGEAPHGQWYHPNVIGGAAPSRHCGSTTEDPSTWAILDCGEGNTAIRLGLTNFVKSWTCKENQYLRNHPNEYTGPPPTSECDCKANLEGLCGASYRCEDYSTCDCNPVGSGVQNFLNAPTISGITEWWADDCECDKSPQETDGSMLACADSIVKWVITESP